MDPHDVSYVENDGDSEEDTPHVKEFSGPLKRTASRKDGDWDTAMQVCRTQLRYVCSMPTLT